MDTIIVLPSYARCVLVSLLTGENDERVDDGDATAGKARTFASLHHVRYPVRRRRPARRAEPHASATHSISRSKSSGQSPTGTNVRAGGLLGKKRA